MNTFAKIKIDSFVLNEKKVKLYQDRIKRFTFISTVLEWSYIIIASTDAAYNVGAMPMLLTKHPYHVHNNYTDVLLNFKPCACYFFLGILLQYTGTTK